MEEDAAQGGRILKKAGSVVALGGTALRPTGEERSSSFGWTPDKIRYVSAFQGMTWWGL